MIDISLFAKSLMDDVGMSFHQALEIFASFFDSYIETEAKLEVCLKEADFDAIVHHAHQLRGTTANLRFNHVSHLAERMEAAARKNQLDPCKTYAQDISKELASLKSQMQVLMNTNNLTVLIVEDNIASAKVLEQIINNLGHESMGIAASPEQALLAVKKEQPDLIFMDIDLSSEMNGIYTAELLSGYYDIPVIFVSIHAEEIFIRHAKRFGLGYIVKPFTSKEVEDMLNIARAEIFKRQDKPVKEPIKIKVKDDNRVFFINMDDVVCFEAQAHTIVAYTEFKSYQFTSSLKDVKELDEQNLFIQTHRSFLVNRTCIDALTHTNYNYQISLRGLSTAIPVSKNNIQKVKEIFQPTIKYESEA